MRGELWLLLLVALLVRPPVVHFPTKQSKARSKAERNSRRRKIFSVCRVADCLDGSRRWRYRRGMMFVEGGKRRAGVPPVFLLSLRVFREEFVVPVSRAARRISGFGCVQTASRHRERFCGGMPLDLVRWLLFLSRRVRCDLRRW